MKQSTKLKIGVYSITSMLYMQVVVSVLLGDIAMVFPNASLYKIQLVFSITSITCMVGSLIAGKLADYINKKTMTVIALIILLLSGAAPIILHSSIDLFIIFSAFVGLAVGILQTLSNTYALELFTGNEREQVIGVNQTIMAIAGTVFIYIAGVFAATDFLNGFYIYFSALIVILSVCAFIPKKYTLKAETTEETVHSKVKVLNKNMVIMLVLMLIFASLQGAFMQNISLLVINSGIGDAAVSGLSVSLYIAGGILVGLVLSPYLKLTKRFALAICFFISGIALLLPIIKLTVLNVYLCGALCGFSCTLFYGICLVEVPNIVAQNGITMACAYISTVFALGSFISPYIVNPLSAIFTSGSDSERLMVAGIATLISGVLAIILKLTQKEEN